MTEVFEGDLKLSTPYTLQGWQNRPWMQRVAEVILIPIKSQL
jgi:cardiolipin synthase A/B